MTWQWVVLILGLTGELVAFAAVLAFSGSTDSSRRAGAPLNVTDELERARDGR